jgi:hypothetical protein
MALIYRAHVNLNEQPLQSAHSHYVLAKEFEGFVASCASCRRQGHQHHGHIATHFQGLQLIYDKKSNAIELLLTQARIIMQIAHSLHVYSLRHCSDQLAPSKRNQTAVPFRPTTAKAEELLPSAASHTPRSS